MIFPHGIVNAIAFEGLLPRTPFALRYPGRLWRRWRRVNLRTNGPEGRWQFPLPFVVRYRTMNGIRIPGFLRRQV